MTTETQTPEYVKLGMICTCSDERRLKADADRQRVIERMSTRHPSRPVTDSNFLTYAVSYLDSWHNGELTIIADQWFGTYVTVKKYVTCEHWDDEADDAVSGVECPDEPECFVYRYDDVLKVAVECDRVEDGVARLVDYFLDLQEWQEALVP